MSVVILGMEMPKEGTVIAIYKLNGKVYASLHGTELCPIVPLPEKHGRLIDEKELREAFGMGKDCALCKQDIRDCQYNPIFTRMEFCGAIDGMKTIIVAEGET